MKKLIIAVDGTSGSGKTATMNEVAKILNYQVIDTGLMYRALTYFALIKKVDLNDSNQIINLLKDFNYEVKDNLVYLNQKLMTNELHQNQIVKAINYITPIPEVREFMVKRQRAMVIGGGVIEIGRDITSIVLPDADLKIFLDSSPEARAQRRFEQNKTNNIVDADVNEIKEDIIKRDHSDMNRKVGPLTIVPDAWYIDNSNLSFDEVVDMIVSKIREMEVVK